MRVELPDGSILEDVPEGTSKRDLQDRLIRSGMGQRLVEKGVDLAAPETSPRPDTPQYKIGVEGLPDAAREVAQEGVGYGMTKGGLGNVLAGVGTKVNDWAMGLKQMAGNELTPEEQGTVKAGRAFRGASTAANIGAAALPVALGALAAPAAGMYGLAAEGGLVGAVEPTLGDESRLGNAALGAGAGLAAGAIGRGLTGVVGRGIVEANPALVAGGKIPTYGELGVAGGKVGAGAVKKAEEFVAGYFAKVPGASPTDVLSAAVSTFGASSGIVYGIASMLGISLPGGAGVAVGLGSAYLPAVRGVLTGASEGAIAKGLRASAPVVTRAGREVVRGALSKKEE